MRTVLKILTCLVLVSSGSVSACKLTFAVSNVYPPYHILKADGEWNGLGVDLFKLLAEKVNCSAEIISIPWGRTIEMLAKGEIDAVSNFSSSTERRIFSHFIGPIHLEKMVVIVKKQLASQLNTESDLINFQGLTGITKGTYFGNELEKLVRHGQLQSHIVEITTQESKIGMLAADRLDAVFEEESVAKYLFNIGTLNSENHAVKLSFTVNPVFIGLSRKSVNLTLAEKFSEAWQSLSEEGQLTTLYAKYGIPFQIANEKF